MASPAPHHEFQMHADWRPPTSARTRGDDDALAAFRAFWTDNGRSKTEETWRHLWDRWCACGLPDRSGIRFRRDHVLTRAAFAQKLVDAERLPDGGLLVGLLDGLVLRDGDIALAAAIADEPTISLVFVGLSEIDVPALITRGAGNQIVTHDLVLSSLCRNTTMAEGVALSSAAPEGVAA